MKRASMRYGIFALLTFAGGFYCFLGYAMNASFSVASPNPNNAKAAMAWLWAGLGLSSIGLGLLIAAWKHRSQA